MKRKRPFSHHPIWTLPVTVVFYIVLKLVAMSNGDQSAILFGLAHLTATVLFHWETTEKIWEGE